MKTTTFRAFVSATIAVSLWCLWLAGPAPGADEKGPAATADAAPAPFTPLGPAQIREARRAVRQAARALDARLARDGENGRRWRRYLRLERLQAVLDRGGEAEPAAADAVYSRLNRDDAGLELVWFVRLRQALGRYLNVSRAVNNPKIEKAYRELVEKTLPQQIETLKTNPTPAAAHDVGYALGWLADFRQADRFVRQTRRQLTRPNLVFEVSAGYVASGVADSVNETTPITDCILGTTIHGTGRTTGRVSVELAPSASEGIIQTVLTGTTHSDNVGYNGPVTIYSTGVTQFTGRGRLVVTPNGIEIEPATAEACTATNIHSICARRAFIERAAWRRACQQKSQAEAIASQHAARRVADRIERQAGEAADDANRRYEKEVYEPLWERNIFAEQATVSTTKSEIRVRAVRAAYNQLAAPGNPPALAEPADVAMQIHQSAVNNSAYTLLAGRVVTEKEFLATVEDILGEVPENLRPEEGKADWTIHFADREPFTITFADGGYTVSLHAAGYQREGKEYPGMDVSATYKIERTDEGLVAVRQGDPEAYPPGFVKGERQLTGREQTLREMLTQRFDKVFSKKFVPKQQLEPRGRLKTAARAPLSQWTTQDGWMTMAWKMGEK